MMTHEAFLSDIEAFLASSGMGAARFGKEAIGDPNFVRNLREGRSPSLKTAERVMGFISSSSAPPPGGDPAPDGREPIPTAGAGGSHDVTDLAVAGHPSTSARSLFSRSPT